MNSPRPSSLRRRAFRALLAFVAAVLVMGIAPFVEAADYDVVCSAQGEKRVVHDAGAPSHAHDHAAHCPLCMPVGAPPAPFALDFTPVQPLAHVLRSIPAARLAALIGASLPARGPPAAS